MDTIFATATPPLKSGVAIIRVSGEKAIHALEIMTRKPPPRIRFASLCKIYNPNNFDLIDEAIVLLFKSPESFTGEDVVELHVHGGRVVIAEVLSSLNSVPGLRAAEPGEFSKRAFLNGKMDLTEAEGLADLINAETIIQAKLALRQKQGELGKLYENWRETILKSLANIEAYIDFPDEEIPEAIVKKIEEAVFDLLSEIKKHLNDNRRGERLREGLQVVIVGPPNVGKSTLLNLLAKRDVAIVSELAGTTRDIIEVSFDLEGYPVTISDTAGIRTNVDGIEAEGIKRALARAKEADLKIMVFDASILGPSDLNRSGLPEFVDMIDKNTILVVNKMDLVNNHNPLFPENNFAQIKASFKNGDGAEEILHSIKQFAQANLGSFSDPLITRERHRKLLKEALDSLEGFSLVKELELAAEDLRLAAVAIGKITGRINVEEILDRIFSSFCIGK